MFLIRSNIRWYAGEIQSAKIAGQSAAICELLGWCFRQFASPLLSLLSGAMDTPLKILGVLCAVLLPSLAGHMSFGMPGFIVGAAIGIALAFGVLRVLQAPVDEGKPFDVMPSDAEQRRTYRTTDDRSQSHRRGIGRDGHGAA